MIADEKVGAKGVKVRCKKCGNIIAVTRDEASVPAAAAPQFSGGGASGGGASAFDDIFGNNPGGQDGEERSPTKVFTTNELEKVRQEQALAKGDVPGPEETQAPAVSEPGASSKAEWYVAINDEQVGPITVEDVQVRWDRGDLNATSLAWKAGLADWAAISQIAELASVASRKQAAKEAPKVADTPKAEEKKEVVTWRPSGASALAELAKQATVEEPKKVEAPAEAPFGMDFNPPSQGASDPFGGGFAGAAAAGPSTVWQFPTSTAKKSNSGTPKWLLGIVAFTLLALVGVVVLFALGILPPKQPQIAMNNPPPVVQQTPPPPPPVVPAVVSPTGPTAPTASAATPTPQPTGVNPVSPTTPNGKKGKKGSKAEKDDEDEKPAPAEAKPSKPAKKDAMDDLLDGKGGGKELKDILGRDDVLSTVKQNLGSIKACADAYARGGGKLPPKLIAKWVIKPSGFTDAQEMVSPELKGTPVDTCVVTAIKKWRFPEYKSGTIPVTFPFPLAQ